MKGYKIIIYQDKNGNSEFLNDLLILEKNVAVNKNARIQYKQIVLCLNLLKEHGTRMSDKITKHIDGKLWELRPGFNRILYFLHKDNQFIILHMFRKKTQKTPKSEIEKAKQEIKDYLSRNY